jgi:hypothetical protein
MEHMPLKHQNHRTTQPHPLLQSLADLRGKVRFLMTVQGAARVIVSLLAVLIALCGIDYLVRFQDGGVLVIFMLAAITTLGWTAYRYLYLPIWPYRFKSAFQAWAIAWPAPWSSCIKRRTIRWPVRPICAARSYRKRPPSASTWTSSRRSTFDLRGVGRLPR